MLNMVNWLNFLIQSMMALPTTDEIASYMKIRFIAELTDSVEQLQMPRFPLELLKECNFAAKLLVKTTRNQGKFSFNFFVVFHYSQFVQ